MLTNGGNHFEIYIYQIIMFIPWTNTILNLNWNSVKLGGWDKPEAIEHGKDPGPSSAHRTKHLPSRKEEEGM